MRTTSVTRGVLGAIWHGAALSALFFYPLIQALDRNRYYLLWQPHDTVEFSLAFLLLALLFGAAWHGVSRLRSLRLQLAGTAALMVIPLASFAVALLRQMPLKEILIPLMAQTDIRLGLAASVALFVVGTLTLAPRLALRMMQGALLLISPVVLIAAITLVRLAGYQGSPHQFGAPPRATASVSLPSVFVFLFDELSYRFIHPNGVVRADLPNLRRLSEIATSYTEARAPAGETLNSVPGLLTGRPFFDVDTDGDTLLEVLPNRERRPLHFTTADSLFVRAKSAGLRAEIVGYYFPYCQLLAGVADACESFSFYNYSTVTQHLSPLNPVLTTFVLWPYQQPSGLLKVPVFSRLQRDITAATVRAATEGLSPPVPRLRFVHFPIPHLPFVFDRSGYNPSDDPMRQDAGNYERQLQYTDAVIGVMLDALVRAGVFHSSTVVVLGDHEYRWPKMIPADAAHIPLIVKRPRQAAGEVVQDPVRAENVLADLIPVR